MLDKFVQFFFEFELRRSQLVKSLNKKLRGLRHMLRINKKIRELDQRIAAHRRYYDPKSSLGPKHRFIDTLRLQFRQQLEEKRIRNLFVQATENQQKTNFVAMQPPVLKKKVTLINLQTKPMKNSRNFFISTKCVSTPKSSRSIKSKRNLSEKSIKYKLIEVAVARQQTQTGPIKREHSLSLKERQFRFRQSKAKRMFEIDEFDQLQVQQLPINLIKKLLKQSSAKLKEESIQLHLSDLTWTRPLQCSILLADLRTQVCRLVHKVVSRQQSIIKQYVDSRDFAYLHLAQYIQQLKDVYIAVFDKESLYQQAIFLDSCSQSQVGSLFANFLSVLKEVESENSFKQAIRNCLSKAIRIRGGQIRLGDQLITVLNN